MVPYVKSLGKAQSSFTRTPKLEGLDSVYSTSQQDVGYIELDNITGFNGPRQRRTVLHAHSYRKQTVRHCRGTVITDGPYYVDTFRGVIRSAISNDPGLNISGVAYDQAVGKLLSRLRDTDLNLATSLAEGKQTLQMVARAVKSVVTWRKSAVSLIMDIGNPLRRGSRAAANRWLEAVFGWRPLMSDAYNLAKFVREYRSEFEVRATGRHQYVTDVVVDDGGYSNRLITSVSERCIISRRYRVTNPNLTDLNRLTSLNPFSIAWELTPLSFVVDWWFDIGGYLQNLETSFGLGYTPVAGAGFNTFTTRAMTSHVATPYAPIRGIGFGSYEITHKNRVLDDTTPTPAFPRLKSAPLGGGQMISAAALVRQKLPNHVNGRTVFDFDRRVYTE